MKQQKAVRINEAASTHLDMIRAVAALEVMAGHLRNLLFVRPESILHRSKWITLGYALTTFSHQAVIVFFVLSGFFIASSVMGKIIDNSWSWRHYLIARLSRLYLVLIPSLLLCVFWDRLGMIVSHFSPDYTKSSPLLVGTGSVLDRTSVSVFLGNLFFLQSARFPVFGSATPLWSLSYEFWYYMMFPILLLIISVNTGQTYRVGYLALIAAIAWLVGPQILLYLLIWLCGAAAAYILGWQLRYKFTVSSRMMALSTVALLGALGLSRVCSMRSEIGADLIASIAFATWILILAHASARPPSAIYAKYARGLAGFSYTLYLVHFPFILFLRTGLLHGHPWQPSARHLMFGLLVSVAVIAYAYAVASITEAKTAAVRAFIVSRMAPDSKRRTALVE